VTRPNDEDDALEAMLAAVAPAAPSADLRRQVAAALAAPSGATPSSLRWLGERLLWACGGAAAAVAASLVLAPSLTPREASPAGAGLRAAPATVPDSPPAPVQAVVPSLAATPGTSADLVPNMEQPASAEQRSATTPVAVSEEMVTWADGGVRFLDDRTPARILRRLAIERHQPAVGPDFRMPREDVILLPVALQ
jgi:hypothetical protein